MDAQLVIELMPALLGLAVLGAILWAEWREGGE